MLSLLGFLDGLIYIACTAGAHRQLVYHFLPGLLQLLLQRNICCHAKWLLHQVLLSSGRTSCLTFCDRPDGFHRK